MPTYMLTPRLQSPPTSQSHPSVKGPYGLQNFKSGSPSGLVNC